MKEVIEFWRPTAEEFINWLKEIGFVEEKGENMHSYKLNLPLRILKALRERALSVEELKEIVKTDDYYLLVAELDYLRKKGYVRQEKGKWYLTGEGRAYYVISVLEKDGWEL